MGVASARFRNLKRVNFSPSQSGLINAPSWQNDTQGTIFFELELPTVWAAAGTDGIISMGSTTSDNSRFFIAHRWQAGGAGYNNLPKIEISTRSNGGTISQLLSTLTLVAGTKYKCAIRGNGSAKKLYINGVPNALNVNSGTNNGDWFNVVTNAKRIAYGTIYIAGAAPVNNHAVRMDQIWYISGYACTDAEVLEFYNNGNPRAVSFANRMPGGSFFSCGDRDSQSIMYDRVGSNNMSLISMPTYIAT